jgi:tRNA acetyltransferase TAN1
MLEKFGDVNAIIEKTVFSGIIQIETSLDNMKVLDNFKEIIEDEPWLIKYCSRVIPIQKECESKLDEIANTAIELSHLMKKNETYRITVEKRHSPLHTKDIISKIADSITNKVSLENSNWEIIIEILRNKTGISVIPPNTILSVDRQKRIELD